MAVGSENPGFYRISEDNKGYYDKRNNFVPSRGTRIGSIKAGASPRAPSALKLGAVAVMRSRPAWR